MLSPRDPAALTAFLAGLSDPSSPDYRHFLTPRQFATRFGASDVGAARGARRTSRASG